MNKLFLLVRLVWRNVLPKAENAKQKGGAEVSARALSRLPSGRRGMQPGACTSYCTSRQLLRCSSSSTIAARCAGYCTRRQLLRCTSSCTVALVDNYCTAPKLLYSTRLLHNAVRCTSSSCSKLLQSYARASVAHFLHCLEIVYIKGNENVSLKMPFILSPRITQCNAMQFSIDGCHCIELPLQH